MLSVALLSAVSMGCADESESQAQIDRELRAALAESSLFERLKRLTQLVAELDEDGQHTAQSVLDEYVAGLSDAEIRIFMSAWARREPAAALDYAKTIPYASQREEAIAVVIQEWASWDPVEARPYAEALEIPRRKRPARPLVRLVRGWAHHPDSGLESYLREQNRRSDLLSAALQELYRLGGAPRLVEWVGDFIGEGTDPERDWQAFRKAVRTIGYRDPQAAAAWVSEEYGRDAYARDGPEVLAEAWALRDPVGAVDWIRRDAPEATRAKALEVAFRQWLRLRVPEAHAWLDAHGDDPFSHPAALAAARHAMAARDPQSAIGFCDRIPPSELLQSCLHTVALQWYEWNPVAAGEWMESSALDPELRDSVRTVKQRLRRPAAGMANMP